MMRLLADENIPLETVRALRTAGHDVFAAGEMAVGASDDTLLKRAAAERRLLISFDLDFGELATRRAQSASDGILLLRFVPRDARDVSELLIALLARPDIVWAEHVSVADRLHVRQRPLHR